MGPGAGVVPLAVVGGAAVEAPGTVESAALAPAPDRLMRFIGQPFTKVASGCLFWSGIALLASGFAAPIGVILLSVGLGLGIASTLISCDDPANLNDLGTHLMESAFLFFAFPACVPLCLTFAVAVAPFAGVAVLAERFGA